MNASKFGDKNSESIDREAVLTADRHTISFDDKFCTQIVKRSLCTSSNSSCTSILMRFVHTFYNLKSSFGESRKYTIFSPLLIEEMPIIQMKYFTN